MFHLYNDDCLKVMASMADSSVDLIATDPPYFGVKADDWDNQWESASAFIDWLETIVIEFRRILKPAGSLYLFASPQMSSRVEAIIAKHFRVENHIVWVKPTGRHLGVNRPSLRRYFTQCERVFFASQYDYSDDAASHRAKGEACRSIIEYFRAALKESGLSQSDINRKLGTSMAGHWFGYSQWALPNRSSYEWLQGVLQGHLARSYDDINTEYQALLANRKHSDRRFFETAERQWYTDVWQTKPVQYYEGKHPCEKPAEIMDQIILASSEPGDVVFDAFVGSGSTGVSALKHGRKFIGSELDTTYYESAKAKLTKTINCVNAAA